MQTKWDFAGSTDMWSTSAGGHLMKVVNLTGFTVPTKVTKSSVCSLSEYITVPLISLFQTTENGDMVKDDTNNLPRHLTNRQSSSTDAWF
jgi:hypothetical protein